MNNFNITHLTKSILALEVVISAYKTYAQSEFISFIEDSCVKRFEFTVEISWKTMKKFLKEFYGKTDKELTMNTIFRLMQGYGYIASWEKWREYYNLRNDTSHDYSQAKATKILEVLEIFIADVKFLAENLEKEINKCNQV